MSAPDLGRQKAAFTFDLTTAVRGRTPESAGCWGVVQAN